MERVMGIEPTRPAWKAGVLPLNYTRKTVVGKTGFEPATPWSQAKYSTKLSYFPTDMDVSTLPQDVALLVDLHYGVP